MSSKRHTGRSGERVAIVGMDALFPGSAGLEAFAASLRAGVDAITEVPPNRWDPEVYLGPVASGRDSGVDRFPTARGGFVDAVARFDAAAHGVMPIAAAGADPDQLLTLDVATRALRDAGYGPGRPVPPDRAGVVLGRGGYAGDGVKRLEQRVRTAEQVVATLRELMPDLDPAQLEAVRQRFHAATPRSGPDTAIGLVPNLVASRVANRLDLHAGAWTVDAACASSLVAVDQAVTALRIGRLDLAIAGGVHLCQDVSFWSVFSQLGALSPTGRIRPFHAEADGLLPGEGVGVLVLKRLSDAERDGDRIHAVVHGCGVASDGRAASLMQPLVAGQLRAVRAAWRDAGLDPERVGLIEAHGTATRAGDAAELDTLRQAFGPSVHEAADDPRRPGLGSVKSMIGHAMPAAGAAGLIKAALAVRDGVRLPTLHATTPSPAVAETCFRLIAEAEPWEAPVADRLAGVDAFGFGGINAHVVVGGHDSSALDPAGPRPSPGAGLPPSSARPADTRLTEPAVEALVLARATSGELASALRKAMAADPEAESPWAEIPRGVGPARLVVLRPTPARLGQALTAVEARTPRRGRGAVLYVPEGQGLLQGPNAGRVAFLCPGVEGSFQPDLGTLPSRLGLTPPTPAPESTEDTRALEQHGLALVEHARFFDDALRACGVAPDAYAGHSVGEWSALVASGRISDEALHGLLGELEPGQLDVPGVDFLAVGAGAERVRAELDALGAATADVVLTHDNAPRQTLACGPADQIDAVATALRARGALARTLPFRSGFHSPFFEPFVAPFERHVAALPLADGHTPQWSATTAEPWPSDAAGIRKLLRRHLVEPVRFRPLVDAMWRAGFRAFVQLGPGSLASYVSDTLKGDARPHLAVAAALDRRPADAQLARVAALLYVEGAEPDLVTAGLVAPAAHDPAQRPADEAPALPRGPSLPLGAPLIRLGRDAASLLGRRPSPTPSAPAGPVGTALAANMEAILRAQAEVLEALEAGPTRATPARATRPSPPRPPSAERVWRLSHASAPWLLDHALFPQRPGWPDPTDRYPVVPMTGMLEHMAAQAAHHAAAHRSPGAPTLKIAGLRAIRASKWLAVPDAAPVDVGVRLAPTDDGAISVELVGHARGDVLVDERWAPVAGDVASFMDVGEPFTPPVSSGDALYEQRWMFHGQAYQGIASIDACGADGIVGTLIAGAAPGALLDNAGQLLGFWVMARTDIDRLAMPVRIDRIEVHGPRPAPGSRVRCAVRVRRLERREVVADLHVAAADGSAPWVTVRGWMDWRFQTSRRLWPVVRQCERRVVSAPAGRGTVAFRLGRRATSALDYLVRRHLIASERAHFEALPAQEAPGWLARRVAAKDAARVRAWGAGAGTIFPAEVALEGPDETLRATVPGADGRPLRLHVAVAGGRRADEPAVALAALSGRPTLALSEDDRTRPPLDALMIEGLDAPLTVDDPDDGAPRPDGLPDGGSSPRALNVPAPAQE